MANLKTFDYVFQGSTFQVSTNSNDHSMLPENVQSMSTNKVAVYWEESAT